MSAHRATARSPANVSFAQPFGIASGRRRVWTPRTSSEADPSILFLKTQTPPKARVRTRRQERCERGGAGRRVARGSVPSRASRQERALARAAEAAAPPRVRYRAPRRNWPRQRRFAEVARPRARASAAQPRLPSHWLQDGCGPSKRLQLVRTGPSQSFTLPTQPQRRPYDQKLAQHR